MGETELWRLELEQTDDGSGAAYPTRGTINLRLRLNRTTQPDPVCADAENPDVTTFLADVEALDSRLQEPTTGTADGSWNCEGFVATVDLDDGTRYELRSDSAPAVLECPDECELGFITDGIVGTRTRHPRGLGLFEGHTWIAGQRRGQFRFVVEELFGDEPAFFGDHVFPTAGRESHVEVLVQNRSGEPWRVGLLPIRVNVGDLVIESTPGAFVGLPNFTTTIVRGAREAAYEDVPVAGTAHLWWPSHFNRRKGFPLDPNPERRQVLHLAAGDDIEDFLIPPIDFDLFLLNCFLEPDHPDQVQLVVEDDRSVTCGEGWVDDAIVISPSRPRLYLRAGGQTVTDTLTVEALLADTLYAETFEPGLTASLNDRFSRSKWVLTVSAAPGTPRGGHNIDLIGEASFVGNDGNDTLTYPVFVYELDVSVDPPSLTAAPGERVTADVSLDRTGLVGEHVMLTAGNLPPGVSASFSPGQTLGTGSTLALDVGDATGPGEADLTVCATIRRDPLQTCHPAVLTLVVEDPTTGACEDFDLRLDFNPITVPAGASDLVPVFVERSAGFGGAVELALEGSADLSPEEVLTSFGFDPNPVDGGSTFSNLSFTMSDGVAPGASFTFTIRGASPSLANPGSECSIPVTFEVI